MSTPHLGRLAQLVEGLVLDPDPGERDRALLDAAFSLEAAGAVAVWKRVPTRGGELVWRATLERGPADALPSETEVTGVLNGTLDPNLPRRRHVLVAGRSRPAVALALGEVENPDGRLDFLEALLHVWLAAVPSTALPIEGLEGLGSLRPQDGEEAEDSEPDPFGSAD